MTLTIPTPDTTRDRVDTLLNMGEKAREIVYSWATDQSGRDGGSITVDLEVDHNHVRKAYTGTLYVTESRHGMSTRTFSIGRSTPETATTADVFTEPTGRYSAKRLREIAPQVLASLSDVPEGSEAWHILRRVPGVTA